MPTAVTENKVYSSKMSESKPKMKSSELVEKIKSKGIDISPHTEEEIETYLLNRNNFFRVCSYRKNYQKYLNGSNKGKYIDLTFDQLKALAILDMKIRKAVLSICIDVEHSLKMKMLQDFESSSEDGYAIIQNFFNTPNGAKVANNIVQKHNSIYIKDLASKYIYPKESDEVYVSTTKDGQEVNLDVSIWALLELMSFGDLLNFYFFYYDNNKVSSLKRPIPNGILHKVKNIRNACAHNNCILNNLSDHSANVPGPIGKYLQQIDICKSSRKKLRCSALCEIVCSFYCLDKLATEPVKKHNYNELSAILAGFYTKYYSLFAKNELVKTSLDFLKSIVDKLNNI